MNKKIVGKYNSDFIIIRHAIYQSFIAKDAPIKEEDLTPHDVYLIIHYVGKYFLEHNVTILAEIPEVEVRIVND